MIDRAWRQNSSTFMMPILWMNHKLQKSSTIKPILGSLWSIQNMTPQYRLQNGLSCSIVWQTSNKLLPHFAADQYKYLFTSEILCSTQPKLWYTLFKLSGYYQIRCHLLYVLIIVTHWHWKWRSAISLSSSVLHFNKRLWCKIVYRAKLYTIQHL